MFVAERVLSGWNKIRGKDVSNFIDGGVTFYKLHISLIETSSPFFLVKKEKTLVVKGPSSTLRKKDQKNLITNFLVNNTSVTYRMPRSG